MTETDMDSNSARRSGTDIDSRARTHLANERTFLAWLRTGLSLIALGLAASQFLHSRVPGSTGVHTLLSFILVIGGACLTLVGTERYFAVQRGLQDGVFPFGRWSIIITTVFAIVIGIGAVAMLVVMQ